MAASPLRTPNPLINYHEALAKVLAAVPQPRSEIRGLTDCLGCLAAAAIIADMDLPPFRKSFMDGYALRSDDLAGTPVTLDCVGEIAAGAAELPAVGPGQCATIMTGAPLPEGADAVQMVEKTRSKGSRVTILESVAAGANVGEAGSEVKTGDVVVEPGRYLGPAEVGVLASFGADRVEVWAPPEVAIAPTGDELVAVDRCPGFGQIRNSSVYMLAAQCRLLGIEPQLLPPVADTPEATRRALEKARGADLLLFTGGVSMGERDYVHRVLVEEGVDVVFHKASIKPGKPLLVGRDGPRLILGLPGNPVSSFVTFELFVRPAIQRWRGLERVGLRVETAELTSEVHQHPGRLWFLPARTTRTAEGRFAEPVPTRGSADLTAFSRADSLILVPADRDRLEAGTNVDVMMLEGRQP